MRIKQIAFHFDKNKRDIVTSVPSYRMFKEYFFSDIGQLLEFDVFGTYFENGDVNVEAFNINYENDESLIKNISADYIDNKSTFYPQDYEILGYYKNKPFTINIKNSDMYAITTSGVEEKFNQTYQKHIKYNDITKKYNNTGKINVDLPQGMKKHIYNTFAFRNALLVITPMLRLMRWQ